jgi:hypothetical protein
VNESTDNLRATGRPVVVQLAICIIARGSHSRSGYAVLLASMKAWRLEGRCAIPEGTFCAAGSLGWFDDTFS